MERTVRRCAGKPEWGIGMVVRVERATMAKCCSGTIAMICIRISDLEAQRVRGDTKCEERDSLRSPLGFPSDFAADQTARRLAGSRQARESQVSPIGSPWDETRAVFPRDLFTECVCRGGLRRDARSLPVAAQTLTYLPN